MRICLYTSTSLPKIGGQELVVDALAKKFSDRGHKVVVLAPRCKGCGDFDTRSLPYTMAWHPRFISTRRLVSWYGRWLARLHRRHNFDLLHCHDTYPSAYVAATCRETASLPMVVTSHGGDMDPGSLLFRKSELAGRYVAALQHADAVVAISTCTEQRFLGVLPEVRRITRIPNGVDLATFIRDVPPPADLPPGIVPEQFLLFLGRLERRKGADLLLNAFAKLAPGNQTKLVVAGVGPQLSALKTLASELGLNHRVCFAGPVFGDTKTWLLRNTVCSVVPSRVAEACGLVVLESGAAGKPVVGTQLPGLSEFIVSDQTGIVVPVESVDGLAEALDRLVGNRELANRMGRQGRKNVQGYDWNNIAQRHLDLFEELLTSHVAGFTGREAGFTGRAAREAA
jgi:glycogen(starch) synthase